MPPAEITRTETSERARLLRVRRLRRHPGPDGGPDTFGSTSRDQVRLHRAGRGQLRGPDRADRARDQAQRHAAGPGGAGRRPDRAAGPGREQRAARGRATAGTPPTAPAAPAVDPADGRIYTYTKFEPAYARTVFANFEQPDLKAAFTIRSPRPRAGPCCRTSRTPGRRSATGRRTGTSSRRRGCRPICSGHRAGEYARGPRAAHDAARPADTARAGVPRSRWRRTWIRTTFRDHRPGPGLLHDPVRARLPVRQVRPGVRAGLQRRRDRERGLRRCRPTRCCSGRGSPTRCTSCAPA